MTKARRIKASKTKNQYDKAFYFAIDKKGKKISASEAAKIRKANPDATFYCPSCYRRSHETRGIPKQYSSPRKSRFDRYSPDAHLPDCPYKNSKKFLLTVAQKLNIKMDNQTMELKLMPYDGRGIIYRSLLERFNTTLRTDHIKFMKLIKYLLQDFDESYFHESYNNVSLPFGKKSKKLKDLFLKIDAIKNTKQPFIEKLNLIIGTIKEVKKVHPYLILIFDQYNSDTFPFCIQLHDHFYEDTLIEQLIGKKIACLGYIKKYGNNYSMEILSIQHQIALLFEDSSPEHKWKPSLSHHKFLSQLHAPYQELTSIPYHSFMQMFYQSKLNQFDTESALLLQQKETRMENIKNELQRISEEQKQTDIEKITLQNQLNQCRKEKKRWLINLFKMSDIRKKEKQYEQLLLEQTELFEKNSTLQISLENEHSQLYSEVNEINSHRGSIEEKHYLEISIKEQTCDDDFFEFPLDLDHSILFQFNANFTNYQLQPLILLVKKANHFIIPISKVHKKSFQARDNMQEIVDNSWSFIQSKINELKHSYSNNLL